MELGSERVQNRERRIRGNLRDKTTDHCREGDTRNDFGLGRGHGAEDTDLDADGSQVGETTKSVLGDDPGAIRERVITAHDRLKAHVGRELVCNQLGGKETRYADNLSTRYTEEKGNGIKNISEDQLKGKVVDTKTLPNPSEQTVDGGDK